MQPLRDEDDGRQLQTGSGDNELMSGMESGVQTGCNERLICRHTMVLQER